MVDESASEPAKIEPHNHQDDSEVSPTVPPAGSPQTTQHNPANSQPPARRPKHGYFDWINLDLVNLLVLSLTLFAAGWAGYEAKRLADETDTIIIDGRKAASDQLTLAYPPRMRVSNFIIHRGTHLDDGSRARSLKRTNGSLAIRANGKSAPECVVSILG
jgi:hypothetical protein